MIVVPLPKKGSSTISPRQEQSMIASATIATGFTVGCNARRLPSLLEREKEFAPGYRQKIDEFGLAHLSRSHQEFRVMNLAEPGGMPIDGNVVGWVREHDARLLVGHQLHIRFTIERVATEHTVFFQEPQIAGLGNLDI